MEAYYDEKSLCFKLLSNGKLAAFLDTPDNGRIIVFPNGEFFPEEGKTYICGVRLTRNATYKYYDNGGKRLKYRVGHAGLWTQEGPSRLDVIEYQAKSPVGGARLGDRFGNVLRAVKTREPSLWEVLSQELGEPVACDLSGFSDCREGLYLFGDDEDYFVVRLSREGNYRNVRIVRAVGVYAYLSKDCFSPWHVAANYRDPSLNTPFYIRRWQEDLRDAIRGFIGRGAVAA